jgi:hypothetical protein
VFRTKRSKERARARGAILARQWIQAIASDVATRPLALTVEALPPRTRAQVQLTFCVYPDGTRELLSHMYRMEPTCNA